MAERFEPRLECLKNLLLREIGKLFAEALKVAEGMLINEADETKEFEQRVLQRRGREQQLVFVGERQLQRPAHGGAPGIWRCAGSQPRTTLGGPSDAH